MFPEMLRRCQFTVKSGALREWTIQFRIFPDVHNCGQGDTKVRHWTPKVCCTQVSVGTFYPS